jgi:hypothetical protein
MRTGARFDHDHTSNDQRPTRLSSSPRQTARQTSLYRGGEFTGAPSFRVLEPQPPNQTTLHEALAIASSKKGVSPAIEVAVALFTTPGDSAR